MQRTSQLILRLFGWKIIGQLPDLKKYVLIVAPHTSNWDLIVGLLARFAVGVRICFMAKKQAFVFPLGSFLKAVGGMPVDRSRKGNTVEQVVTMFRNSERLVIGLTPEGTRSPVKRWKEGFYYMAVEAGVPIVMVGFDYATKEVRVQEPFQPTGDINNEFPKIIEFFRTINGKYPKEIPDYHLKA